MARAKAIWVAIRAVGRNEPIAAFTVKHECVTWLKQRTMYESPVRIMKLKDGYEDAVETLSSDFFLMGTDQARDDE